MRSKADWLVPTITSIKNNNIRTMASVITGSAPNYWYELPASSSGKYHNKQDLGDGGLLRHSIKTFKIMDYMLNMDHVKQELEKDLEVYDSVTIEEYYDLLKVAALIHDIAKYGVGRKASEHTLFGHPVLIYRFFENKRFDAYFLDYIAILCSLIETHHGQWNRSEYSNTVLKLPKTKGQKLLHECDYLASRQDITIDLPECEDTEEENGKE